VSLRLADYIVKVDSDASRRSRTPMRSVSRPNTVQQDKMGERPNTGDSGPNPVLRSRNPSYDKLSNSEKDQRPSSSRREPGENASSLALQPFESSLTRRSSDVDLNRVFTQHDKFYDGVIAARDEEFDVFESSLGKIDGFLKEIRGKNGTLLSKLQKLDEDVGAIRERLKERINSNQKSRLSKLHG